MKLEESIEHLDKSMTLYVWVMTGVLALQLVFRFTDVFPAEWNTRGLDFLWVFALMMIVQSARVLARDSRRFMLRFIIALAETIAIIALAFV